MTLGNRILFEGITKGIPVARLLGIIKLKRGENNENELKVGFRGTTG